MTPGITNSLPLRVLSIDDSADDLLFLERTLTGAGLPVTYDRLESAERIHSSLLKGYDIILTDFYLKDSTTAFDVLAAVYKARCQIPVIVVSGTRSEHLARPLLDAGARDYVLKGDSEPLLAAIRRETRDWGERKSQIELLLGREELLQTVLDNIPVGIWITDKAGRIISGNPAALKIWEGAHFVGVDQYKRYRAFWLNTGKEVQPDEWASARVLQTGKSIVDQSVEIETFEGARKVIVNSAAPLVDSAGEIMGAVIVNKDITEKHRALQELKREKERFAKIFAASPTGICVSNLATGKIVDINDAFTEATGFGKEEAIGTTWTELGLWTNPDQETLLKAEAMKAVNGGVKNLEVPYKTKSGKIGHVLVSMETFSVDDVPCLVTFFNDVTSRKLLETQFFRAQKMESIGLLAGGVAHDFNNVLTVIQGYSAMMGSCDGLSGEIMEGLREIEVAADKAAQLTRQLLAFGRKQVMKVETIDLNATVESLARMLRRVVGEHVELNLALLPDLPSIKADAGMVEQVLMNLSVNARDAMLPKGGKLTIRTHRAVFLERDCVNNLEVKPGEYVCISVVDTGCGMSPAVLSRIFEPFFTTKEDGRGTGLGLPSVYGIMKQHGGWMNVQSIEGSGSTFEAYFPAVARVSNVPSREVRRSSEIFEGKETILLAEDDDNLRGLVSSLLQRRGYKVVSFSSGVEALKWRNSHPGKVDLLLTDLVMPKGMNGLELAKQLRVQDPALKVIYSSGYSTDIAGTDLAQSERLYFIQKPYHPADLCKIIRQCLDSQ